jgi:Raf kinase inhibitor-like YbhB/YbcL family protein
MKTLLITTALVAAIAAPAVAQTPAPNPALVAAQARQALVELVTKDAKKLTVSTPAWKDGADIPYENTQYRTNTFPGLTWTKGPKGTLSYALIMQDTDGQMRGAPILHWTLYNIPSSVTKLEPGMKPDGNPGGSSYGPNYQGNAKPYLGPRTPAGPKHHYHLQILALDTVIQADSAITYDQLAAQMKGHVLAAGETVGLGSVDPTAPPPPPRPAPPAAK